MRAPTISEVAKTAGVSVATVSRVVNGSPSVSHETQARVQEAIERLGYQPNVWGRSLRRGESRVVLVIVPNVSNPYYAPIIAGTEDRLHEDGYSGMLCITNAEAERRALYLEFLKDGRADGAILMEPARDDPHVTGMARHYHLVQCSEYCDNQAVSHVSVDNLAAARQAVADAKAELEESKAAEESAKADLETQKADLVKEQASVEATIQEITSQSSVYAQKMDELEDDSASVSSQIAQAEKTYQAQIAAQKKAEEEAARKKAEEEAKKQQQQQNQNNSNSNSNSKPSGGGGTAGSGGYLWPLSGYTRVSSPFGYRNCPFHGQELHGGCDIPAPYGTPIKAAKSGVVIISTYGSSYGNYVTIAHSDGSRTMYAHQSQRAVSAGQTVSQGEVIGYVGSTGSSTGNHLHFELWLNSSSSSRVNPVAYCF